jgi:hypothetical protein
MGADQPDNRRGTSSKGDLGVGYDEMLERFRKQMLEAAGVRRAYQASMPTRPRARRDAP